MYSPNPRIQTIYYGGIVTGYGALPATTQVTLATGAVFDLNGISQTVGLAGRFQRRRRRRV